METSKKDIDLKKIDPKIELKESLAKTHEAGKTATRVMFVPGLGEVDINKVEAGEKRKIETLEKFGVLVKKESKASAKP